MKEVLAEMSLLLIGEICKFTSKKFEVSVHKKLSFPFSISSTNVTKSVVSCGLGHIY